MFLQILTTLTHSPWSTCAHGFYAAMSYHIFVILLSLSLSLGWHRALQQHNKKFTSVKQDGNFKEKKSVCVCVKTKVVGVLVVWVSGIVKA